jgi:hypothetical protein
MLPRKAFFMTVMLVMWMVMTVFVYALEPPDAGISAPVMDQDAIFKEIDINLLKDIDSEVLELMDENRDGVVSLAEFTEIGGSDILFQIADANKDHYLTINDLNTFTETIESDGQEEQLMAACCWIYYVHVWYYICWAG